MSRPIPWQGAPAPDGYRFEAVPAHDGWRVAEEGKKCRANAGYHKSACGAPAVAELLRSTAAGGRRWAYCANHMYGRWIEDGQVMQWSLRAEADS